MREHDWQANASNATAASYYTHGQSTSLLEVLTSYGKRRLYTKRHC